MVFPTDPPKEYKTFPFAVTELDVQGRTLEGYASVFNNIDRVGDIVLPGAFAKTLVENGSRLMLLWQHDNKEPLGPVCLAREDVRGLYTKSIISDTARGRDVLALLKDGASLGMSFGYDPTDSEPSLTPDGQAVRKLKQVRLHEVSLVTFPANPEARVIALKDEGEPAEAKPYPNEHACRLRPPDKFQGDSMRRMTRMHEDREYSVIMGRLEGESTMTEQAYRYLKDKWTEAQARAHCDAHEGATFEPASGEESAAPPPAESKVGRVLAKRNADRIKGIRGKLKEIHDLIAELESDAGLVSEVGDNLDEDANDKPSDAASASRAEPPEDKALTPGAGPVKPPTPDKEATLRRIAILEAELAFMEV